MQYDKPTAKRIYNFLIENGMTEAGAIGMMANIYAESGFVSINVENTGNRKLGISDVDYTAKVDNGTHDFIDRIGYGLCQWTSGNRKRNLLALAKSQGKSIGDEALQLSFLIMELKTSYRQVLDKLITSNDISDCTKYVMLKFERPADQSENAQNRRANYGLQLAKDLEVVIEEAREEKMTVKAFSKAKNGNENLSANFKVKEFACKDGSDPIFISMELVDVLQKIRNHFGKPVNINSAYRTPSHNKKEGGVDYSQHLYGMASDIRISGVSPKEVAKYAETLLPNKGGIGIYSTFTHIDVRETKSRWNG